MITIQHNGAQLQFPDTMSQDAIAAAMKSLPPTAPEQGLVGRSVDNLVGGVQDAFDTLYDTESGNPYNDNKKTDIPVAGPAIDWVSRSLHGGGKIGDAVGEVVGDVAGTAYEALGSPLKEEGTAAIGAVMDSAPVKAVGSALGAATEEFPGAAKYMSDAMSVASLVSPAKSPKIGPTGYASKLEKARHAKTRTKGVQRLLEPDMDDFKQFDQKGPLKTKEWAPSAWELEMIDEVKKIPGVRPKGSFTGNHNVVKKAAVEAAEKLESDIIKHGTPVPVSSVYKALDDSVKLIDKTPTLVGDAGTSAHRIYAMFKTKIQEHAAANGGKIDPVELLRIRKALDTELGIFKHSTQGATSAREVAGREIREKLNEIVQKAAPDVDVTGSLNQQHKMLTARDLLHTRMGQEANNAVTQFIANFERATGFKHPTTPLAGAATLMHAPVAAATLIGAIVYGTGAKITDKALIGLRKAIESPQYGLKAAEKAAIISMIHQYREENAE